jgi:hypothetical protein
MTRAQNASLLLPRNEAVERLEYAWSQVPVALVVVADLLMLALEYS